MIPCPMCGLKPWPHTTDQQIERCDAILAGWKPTGLFASEPKENE